MLGIVLADNFVMMFIFWELVGVSSYLLIGFWYEKPSAADACKKAFLTNRVGDFGFLLGILTVWAALGHHLNFAELESYLRSGHSESYALVASAAGLLIFCGAVGKSAQFPLHVWLPDAMEGPTPVSVKVDSMRGDNGGGAGVSIAALVGSSSCSTCPGSYALQVIAWVGGFTALLAAVIAVQQNDIKRILAYSTLSQLGYMIMAVGLRARTGAPAMFRFTTHAFFKALLFLGAGSAILGLHHEQNIWQMGGLRKKMPVTFWTFLRRRTGPCGVLAYLADFQQGQYLAQASRLRQSRRCSCSGVIVVALLTTRSTCPGLVLVVFFGGERSDAAGSRARISQHAWWPLCGCWRYSA